MYRSVRRFDRVSAFALLIGLSILVPRGGHAGFVLPINAPAIMSLTPASEPMIAIATAGDHFVAVGARGIIIYSSDLTGSSWTQAQVPVQSDLVSVQFVDANNGWACGHNGVILHTADGGKTWAKQLDGVAAKTVFEASYNQQISGGNNTLSADLQEVQQNFDPGPTLPWLSVWFETPATGYAVGSFGDIAMTTDGGKTWTPWLDHVDNSNFYDLDEIRDIAGTLYIAGEQGGVYVFDPAKQHFDARPTGYDGILFGITGSAKSVVTFGLEGVIYHSEDQGKTWAKSTSPSDSSIMDGTVLPDGRVVLVNIDGGVLVSTDDGKTFQLSPQGQDAPIAGVATANGKAVLAGLAGVKAVVP